MEKNEWDLCCVLLFPSLFYCKKQPIHRAICGCRVQENTPIRSSLNGSRKPLSFLSPCGMHTKLFMCKPAKSLWIIGCGTTRFGSVRLVAMPE
jgi:hypothetical protein